MCDYLGINVKCTYHFGINVQNVYFTFNPSIHLTAIFFETGAMSMPTKSPNPTVLSQGVLLVPNSQTLAGFGIGDLRSVTVGVF